MSKTLAEGVGMTDQRKASRQCEEDAGLLVFKGSIQRITPDGGAAVVALDHFADGDVKYAIIDTQTVGRVALMNATGAFTPNMHVEGRGILMGNAIKAVEVHALSQAIDRIEILAP